MKPAMAWLPPGLLAALTAALLLTPTTWAADVGYVEDFALAKDRAAALQQLIPGTEDYYYYHALHLLNTEQFEKLAEFTRPWLERHGRTARFVEVEVRRALLGYDKDPKGTRDYLVSHLGLRFNHQRETLGTAADLPTVLDPKRIARDTLRADSFARWGNLENFEPSALDWLAAVDLTWERRRDLLRQLQRPDLLNLPALIDEDLKAAHAEPFGTYPVHAMLTRPQLEELLKRRPKMLEDRNFVNVWLTKLHPSADADWRRDKAVALDYFIRLQALVDRLPPVHNPLKAHVLYHRLMLDRSEGIYDKERFLAYLKLPRFQPYMAKAWNDRPESHRFPALLNVDYAPYTLLPPINADEGLVRDALKHFLLASPGIGEFEPYVDGTYLTHLFAEVKAENGLGDPETWASRLPPDLFAQIKNRIDIDFAFTSKTDFGADEPVKLDLFVKNVPTLLVKVFEVNTPNFYRTHLRELDTDVNLDGLVPNAEQSHRFGEPPLRRTARTFEFPQLTKPGVYVVDFIGNGRSSRALIRKGRLRPIVSTGTAGQNVTVVDEANKPVPDATVWFGEQEYRCDKTGRAVIPFTAKPGRRPVVLGRGNFASLDIIDYQAENYHLAAGIHVDRESLLARRTAALIVRPALFLNGRMVSIKLLEEVALRLTSVDQTGIATSTEIPNFKLFEDRESVHDFRVPARLHHLTITLTAKVKSLSLGKPVDLAASQTFGLNEIDQTEKTEDLHLAKFGSDYVIELLGRTGETKADRPVQVMLKHRDFKEPVGLTLKTNVRGRVVLGSLPDIATVTATGPEGTAHTWPLPTDHHTYRSTLHAKAGEAVTVPYLGHAAKPTREEFALFEIRDKIIAADRFDSLSLRAGLLEASRLEAGDYELWLKRSGEKIRLRITEGSAVAGYILGQLRQLQVPGLKPVQIAAIGADADAVTVKLTDANKFSRVHIFASRYLPAFSPFADLARVRDAGLVGVVPTRPASVYLTGRNIGDEYRYVLDRRGTKKFPGNMLDRPQLLLNPWSIRSTETGEQVAQAGDAFGPRGLPSDSQRLPEPDHPLHHPRPGHAPEGGGDFADLDYLADTSAVLLNLEPDKNGVVRIDRKKLGAHAWVHVAVVDPLSTTVRSTSLQELPAKFLDLRLREGLDPNGHFTQQKQVTVLAPGGNFVIADVAGSRFEAYDSLAKVYALYATLSQDPKLVEFGFVLNWAKTKDAEKRALYSKHACHELNFFLFKKDPAFFAVVVKPYLANKKDKTFLDHWLLGNELARFRDPWQFGRLNTVEQVLLAQRLAGEQALTARHLDDLLRLLPPDAARDLILFDTAVRSSELTKDGTSTFNRERDRKQSAGRLRTEGVGTLADKPAGKDEAPSAEKLAAGGFAGGLDGRLLSGLQGRSGATKDKLSPSSGGGGGRADEAKRKSEDAAEKKTGEAAELKGEKARLGFFLEEARQKSLTRQLYRKLDPTMEWAENNYYKLRIAEQNAGLVPVGAFWRDYARYAGPGPFLSRHLVDASRNFTEIMFALSVLDLPFEPAKHQLAFAGGKMTLGPAGPVIAFHEEVRRTEAPDGKVSVLVGQNFYRPSDRFREENGEKADKYVSGEFIVHTAYGCQVVVTNPTPTRQRLSLLVQVPVGSIPLVDGRFTRTVLLDLEPYHTQTVDYLFYFPKAGRFNHFPAHVAKNEHAVAAARPTTFDVVEKPTKHDTESWDYLSQFGTADEVIALLYRENVNALNLEKIAFRMRDKAFFNRVTALLKSRHVYQPTLWSYGLYHNEPGTAREYLSHVDSLVAQCGGPIDSPLLTVRPVERHDYEHLEYKPLVNARAHSLGARRQIVNGPLFEQYHRLLKTLTYRHQLDDTDLLAVVYYLLLQDRIEEAQAAFARVHPERVATALQYDYCAAYLALFDEDAGRARAIAVKYRDHPVDRWRIAFATIVGQLDEAAGRGAQIADANDPTRRQGVLAATEPGFEVAVEGRGVALAWQNLGAVTVNYYLMDVELLFSRSPFVQQGNSRFAFTKPNASAVIKLPADKLKLPIPLPEDLANRNVLVEVTAAGKTRAVPYYAAAMDVKLTENYGQLKVSDAAAGKPLSKVYVKVYAKLADGSVKFHKDGYTDIRGRFDYASVNSPERQAVERFAVLVLSENRGAAIREAAPPQQ